MAKKICKNCKHYNPPTRKFTIDQDIGECVCEKFVYGGGGPNKECFPLDDKLEYWDYEGYDAGFAVGKNFGCIHFTPNK